MKGLKFDFVSSAVLESKTKEKRINFILNKVKDGTILVTDGVMKPDEEMELIKETMRRVDSGFPGIEVASLKKQTKGFQLIIEKFNDQKEKIQNLFAAITGSTREKTGLKTGLTFIGPAKYIKKIRKNPDSFSILTEV
ncbi:MAG: OapB/ArvB family protein [Candidatus Heimdallarchaeota archaeon]